MQMGDLDLGPGDYHVSPQGSRHDQISSRQGALTYLRGLLSEIWREWHWNLSVA